MKDRSNQKMLFLCLLTVMVLAVGLDQLFIRGQLREVMYGNNNPKVLAEIFLIFLWFSFSLCVVKKSWARIFLTLFGILAVTWCHQTLTPLVISGGYSLFLFVLGNMGARLAGGWKGKDAPFFVSAVMGAGIWMVMVCCVSAFQLGGTGLWRGTALALAVLAGLWSLKRGPAPVLQKLRECKWENRDGIFLALIFTCILLQAGRMNIALDYDSLHYGLRSPYVLDNGRGIYEDLGSINVVYTYAKGLEVLALPLSGSPSYGFVLSFNIWLAIGVLYMGYRLAKLYGGARRGMFAAALMALTPGILNMAITAKSDIITLFFQMASIEGLAWIEKSKDREEQARLLLAVLGACLISYTLKPTSLVFSTAVAGFGLFYLVISGRNIFKWLTRGAGAYRLVIIPLTALAGIWARTYRLTGMPSTSVFTSIWELLGFRARWPFAFSSIPNEGISLGFWGGLRHLGERLLKMFFAPIGADMDHVIIAWGTGLLLISLAAAVLYRKQARARLYYLLLLLVTGLSVVSVYLLWQVDGNYFMLWYAMAAVCGAIAVPEIKTAFLKNWARGLAVLTAAFQLGVMALTSWAGGVGFTPVSFVHRGYYDHRAESILKAREEGREEIWKFLSADPTNRVVAFGEHPGCLDFACNVQSYFDITGSGGNVVLVKTLENFKDYLRYAKTGYIYAEAGHLEEGSREWDVLRYLVEEGSLTDIRYENGNMVARVSLDGAGYGAEEAARAAEEFYRMIILK